MFCLKKGERELYFRKVLKSIKQIIKTMQRFAICKCFLNNCLNNNYLKELNYSGAGGSRTLVQTGDKIAFYMFIFSLIFVRVLGKSTRNESYSFEFRYKTRTFL